MEGDLSPLPADREHYTRILFLPPALTNRHDDPAASSPRRSASGRSQTPGRTPARMPPPPPRNSIFDEPGTSAGEWLNSRPDSPTKTAAFPSPSPSYANGHPRTPGLVTGDTHPGVYSSLQIEDEWVTVFGITQNDRDLILKEFYSCGEIETSGTFGGPSTSNWVNIKYKTRDGALRALNRHGDLIDGRLIVGVMPLSAKDRAVIERELSYTREHMPTPSDLGDAWTPQAGVVTGPAGGTPYPWHRPTIPVVYSETPAREARVDRPPSPVTRTPLQQTEGMPTPVKGWLSPFKEFIMGT
ncbi:unnamed protein product [Ostreobium quekettii]|uniref:RRM Nup35-type domain-containing protein n=1 Tax=Ostreobium quekettii TaxID=121088 RepID=A0A8S1IXS9_9CHLO|nr:unnamed protein product [Ostreobium quekettii]|eukprot:evm.model.scf_30EXC.7 EVM.evm.TU.scf_30EXC.7   scf_30EXC:111519-114129(+)